MKQTTQQIIDTISNSKKTTPVQVLVKGDFCKDNVKEFEFYQGLDFWILYSDWSEVQPWIQKNRNKILSLRIETDRRNSAIPLMDLLPLEARIEPGAYIRDMVTIGKKVVVMMGAVINIGASIGEHTMIDMNAVIGGR
ncbi:MAG: 2,3,4,5-tetrahydropyridine-2,6-dicarboxylate N-acetyltransferase, partial [Caldisericia bacterium]|nr:2,3,4,5-tetrahydropyridine-2,6-dicarboxylate N-acetyltransferase [Caldisericia bacterium]